MPAPGHANKTIQRAAQLPLFAEDARSCICFRCLQHIRGYGFYTLYGALERPDGTRIHACGEFVHHRCPGPDAPPRTAEHDETLFLGQNRPSRSSQYIAPGISLQSNGRYAAQWDKHRLGTHETRAKAQQAIDLYKAEIETGKKRKRKQKTL